MWFAFQLTLSFVGGWGGRKWKFNTSYKLNISAGNFLDEYHVVLSDGQFTVWSARYWSVVHNYKNNQNKRYTVEAAYYNRG